MMLAEYKALLVYPRARSGPGDVHTSTGYYKRAPYLPLGLVTLAALFPKNWNIRLIDTNLKPLTDEDLLWSNFVFTGGMIVHRDNVIEILQRSHSFKKAVIVGGPDATDSPFLYSEADHVVVGEAEVVFQELLVNLESGISGVQYGNRQKTVDIAQVPVPRYDLVDPKLYTFGSIQISRGCPFVCEFCSVPSLGGKSQRIKSGNQVVMELEALRSAGFSGDINVIDDNLIGNTRAIKPVLETIARWGEANQFPFAFNVSATFNLVADDYLLELFARTPIHLLFIGIETPSKNILKQMKKFQNLRKDLAESVRKIQSYGILVACGFILGNDGETKESINEVLDLIESCYLDVTSISLLTAFAHTPLYDRMVTEKRVLWKIDEEDLEESHCEYGLNFIPQRDRQEILRDYLAVIERLTSPAFFFRQTLGLAKFLGIGRELRMPPPSPRPFLKRMRDTLQVLSYLSFKRGEAFWVLVTLILCLLFYRKRIPLFWVRLLNYFFRRDSFRLNKMGVLKLLKHIDESPEDSLWRKKVNAVGTTFGVAFT